jgi:hypothetical protein
MRQRSHPCDPWLVAALLAGVLALALHVALIVLSMPHASARVAQAAALAQPLALAVAEAGDEHARQLVLRENGRDVGSIAIPPGVTRAALDEGIAAALWHPNGRDVAAGVNGNGGSFVVVFLEQPTGTFLAVDVSRVERANIGGIGPSRRYTQRQTKPVEWLPRSRIEGTGAYRNRPAVQIPLQTPVWDEARVRYAGTEALIITRDGMRLWR